MNAAIAGPLLEFCQRAGLAPPLQTSPVRNGRNSQVWRLSNLHGAWVLKHYYQRPGDTRDRLSTEFGFLEFLRDAGVGNVPAPLACDAELGCGLYSLLPGDRPEQITDDDVRQAAEFIERINREGSAAAARALPKAADACQSWQDHLDLVQRRLDQLLALRPRAEVELAAQAFVRDLLAPHWQQVHAEASTAAVADPRSGGAILSPSDFGFHNSLRHQQHLSFLDFEYAGWDDPAKLICDFLCQPELPVSAAQGHQFLDAMLQWQADAHGVGRRVKHLLPVHRLKWCCLMLNEFKFDDRQRRLHAGVDGEDLLARQLAKAQTYFQTHFS